VTSERSCKTDRSCYSPPVRKGEATRQQIVDTALQRASELGLEGVTLGRLAEELQISKSGLFAHFKSKEALQIAVLEEAIERFTEPTGWPPTAFSRDSSSGGVLLRRSPSTSRPRRTVSRAH